MCGSFHGELLNNQMVIMDIPPPFKLNLVGDTLGCACAATRERETAFMEPVLGPTGGSETKDRDPTLKLWIIGSSGGEVLNPNMGHWHIIIYSTLW
jgi:hypothetical protein